MKTKRSTRSQPKGGSHEPITGIVNDRTNNMLNINVVRPTKKNSQASMATSKESFANKPPKTLKNHMLIDIPQAPSRPITEVGTPVSFLSFQRKKKPNESFVWDAVDAVTSPTDILLSPRKQNLIAKMSKPTTPSKQDKSLSLPYPQATQSNSTFSIPKPKSQIASTKTRDDDILSYTDELLFSESVFDFPSSAPASCNIIKWKCFWLDKVEQI